MPNVESEQDKRRDPGVWCLFFDLQSVSCLHPHDAPARNPDASQLRQTTVLANRKMPQNLEMTKGIEVLTALLSFSAVCGKEGKGSQR